MTEHAPSHVPLSARCPWVDAARVLAIAMVATSHLYLGGCGWEGGYCAGGAVGLFFFLAGYFSRPARVGTCLKRTLSLFLCYVFWATFNLLLAKHCTGITLQDLWHNLWYEGGVYWFLRHLVFAFLAGIVYSRLPGIARLATLVALFYFSSIWLMTHTISHSFGICSMGMFAFLCGISAQSLPLPQLGQLALPVPQKYMPLAFTSLVIMLALALAACFGRWDCGDPLPVSMLVGWILLAFCHAGGIVMPRCCGAVAAAGPAVVLFYVVHHPIIRVYTSAWIQFTGDFPPAWFDVLFLVSALVACTWLTGKLRGKNRITDIIFFAR